MTAPRVSAYESMDLTPAAASPGAWGQLGARTLLLASTYDEAVNRILGHVGEEAGADRAWLFLYDHSGTHFYNTHEWCRSGIKAFVDALQHTPVSMIAWLQTWLLANQAVLIDDIGRMPRSAAALRAEFRRQGNRSVLCVPLFHEERLWGCIGFDAVRQVVRWPLATARALQGVGELAACAAGNAPARERLLVTKPNASLYLRDAEGVCRVEIDAIAGIRAERDYSRVHLVGGRTFLELRPLKTWLSSLPKDRFQQIHRGAIVHVHRLQVIEQRPGGRWFAVLAGLNLKWPVGRKYRSAVRSRLAV